MARTNTRPKLPAIHTHEGAPAKRSTPIEQLRRAVMSCFLFEGEFYEDGVSISERITSLAAKVSVYDLALVAIEARHDMNLRHVPLLLLTELVKRANEWDRSRFDENEDSAKSIAYIIGLVVQRADEPGELLSLYWRNGKKPLSAQLKKGLARAMQAFSAYQLAKYDSSKAKVKLRDVLFLSHAKPLDAEQEAIWKKLIDGTLEAPDTWEVALSGGADKKETFERLIKEGKLGYFALIRNLRNMSQAGVDRRLVLDAIRARKNGAEKLLPFRYVAAVRAAPEYAAALDEAMQAAVSELPKLPGTTVVLVDVSGSMDWATAGKSDLKRVDAACALACLVNGDDVRVFSFSEQTVEVPAHKGLAGMEAIARSQEHMGTRLGQAIRAVNAKVKYDRLIVITDEQSHDAVGAPLPGAKGYMVNVASYENGVAYGPWVKVNGFSDKILHWIHMYETGETDARAS